MADEVTVLFNDFNELAEKFYQGLGNGVAKTAHDIADGYSATAPRETGDMADSSYVVTSKENTYDSVATPSHEDAYLLPCVDTPPDDVTAYAAVAVNYAEFVELGHHTRSGSFVPAQPAFYPAVDAAGGQLEGNLVDGVIAAMGGS